MSPALKEFSREEFINMMTRNEPVCVWLTKQVLRGLGHPSKIDSTVERLRSNKFRDFLANLISLLANMK